MKTLKESLLSGQNKVMSVGDKFEKDIQNFNRMLNATSLNDYNECVEKFIEILDVKQTPSANDCVARIDKSVMPIKGKAQTLYYIYIGYRNKNKAYAINFSPWVNKTITDIKYTRVCKPINMESTYYGIIPKILELSLYNIK